MKTFFLFVIAVVMLFGLAGIERNIQHVADAINRVADAINANRK
jgi:hypothetical protein